MTTDRRGFLGGLLSAPIVAGLNSEQPKSSTQKIKLGKPYPAEDSKHFWHGKNAKLWVNRIESRGACQVKLTLNKVIGTRLDVKAFYSAAEVEHLLKYYNDNTVLPVIFQNGVHEYSFDATIHEAIFDAPCDGALQLKMVLAVVGELSVCAT